MPDRTTPPVPPHSKAPPPPPTSPYKGSPSLKIPKVLKSFQKKEKITKNDKKSKYHHHHHLNHHHHHNYKHLHQYHHHHQRATATTATATTAATGVRKAVRPSAGVKGGVKEKCGSGGGSSGGGSGSGGGGSCSGGVFLHSSKMTTTTTAAATTTTTTTSLYPTLPDPTTSLIAPLSLALPTLTPTPTPTPIPTPTPTPTPIPTPRHTIPPPPLPLPSLCMQGESEIVDLLTCPVCMEEYGGGGGGGGGGGQPLFLLCHHSVCRNCLPKLIKTHLTRGGREQAEVVCPECRVVTLVPPGGLTQNFYLVSLIEAKKRRPKEASSRLRMWCDTCGSVALDRCAGHTLSHLNHVLESLATDYHTQHRHTATMLQERVREEGEKVVEVREALEELDRAASYVREKLEQRLERSSLRQTTVTSLLMEVHQMERKIDTMGGRKGADTPSPPSPSLTGSEPFVSSSQGASSGSEGCSLTRSVSSVESYGSNPDKFGYSSDKRSHTLDRYGSALDRFTSTSDRLTSALDKFGSSPDKFGSSSVKFGSSSVKFGSGTERSKSLPEKYSIDLGISQFGLGGEISGLTFRTGLEKHVSGLERSNSSPAKYLSPDKREKTNEQPDFLTETHKFLSGKQERPENFKTGKTNTETGSEVNHTGYGIENRQKPNIDKEKTGLNTEKHGYGYENRTGDMENLQYGLDKEETASGPGLATSRAWKRNEEEIEREKVNCLSYGRKEERMTTGREMEGNIVFLRACLASLREVEGKVEELEDSGGKGDRWEREEREEREFTCHSLINVFERVVRVLEEV